MIAATDYAQQVILPGLLSKIRQQAPGLKVIIQDMEIDILSDSMTMGRVDLVITIPYFVSSSYPCGTLFTENHVCVTSRDSSLAGKSISLEELSQYPQIITSPSRPNFRGSIDFWFDKFGLERNVVISAPCFSIVPLFLETTDTIAFLPSRALVNSNLAVVHLEENSLSFDVIYAWHPRSNNHALHNWVVDLLRSE